jgi:hypothetical protein
MIFRYLTVDAVFQSVLGAGLWPWLQLEVCQIAGCTTDLKRDNVIQFEVAGRSAVQQ